MITSSNTAAVCEGRAFIPSVPHNKDGDPVELEPLFDSQVVQNYRGYSELCECMAVGVENKGLERPYGNAIRNTND
jgi:hypothetical protein